MRFLSPGWIDALDGAVAAGDLGRHLEPGQALVVEQVVEAGDGHDEVAYQIAIARDGSSVAPGRARAPTVRFTTDRATAAAVHHGTESARTAFAAGRLHVEGDLEALVGHTDLLGRLGEVVASVDPTAAADPEGPAGPTGPADPSSPTSPASPAATA